MTHEGHFKETVRITAVKLVQKNFVLVIEGHVIKMQAALFLNPVRFVFDSYEIPYGLSTFIIHNNVKYTRAIYVWLCWKHAPLMVSVDSCLKSFIDSAIEAENSEKERLNKFKRIQLYGNLVSLLHNDLAVVISRNSKVINQNQNNKNIFYVGVSCDFIK